MAVTGALPQPVILLACGSFNPITTMHLRMMELARDKLELVSLPNNSKHGNAEGRHNHPSPSSTSGSVVIGGILSPTSDAYAKPNLLSAHMRVELARLACQFHSDWLAVDSWEASQPTFTRTRVVADRLQSIVHRIWLDVDRAENLCTELPAADTLSPGLASEAWITNCFRQTLTHLRGTQRTQSTSFESTVTDGSILPNTCLPNISTAGFWSEPRVKLVCGADFVESFGVPNLWLEEDINAIVRDYGLICISRLGADPAKVISSLDPLRKNEDNILHVSDGCKNAVASTIVRHLLQTGQSARYLVPDAALDMIYNLGLYGAQRRWQRKTSPKI